VPNRIETVQLVENPVRIMEFHLYGFICPICRQIVWAKLPVGVIEGQLFALRLRTLIAYMKGSPHAPYSSLEDVCSNALNIKVARSHLCNTIRRFAEPLAVPSNYFQTSTPSLMVRHSQTPPLSAPPNSIRNI